MLASFFVMLVIIVTKFVAILPNIATKGKISDFAPLCCNIGQYSNKFGYDNARYGNPQGCR